MARVNIVKQIKIDGNWVLRSMTVGVLNVPECSTLSSKDANGRGSPSKVHEDHKTLPRNADQLRPERSSVV